MKKIKTALSIVTLLAASSSLHAANILQDSSFETDQVGSGYWGAQIYNPGGTAWNFSGYSGIGGAWGGITGTYAPDGTKVGFLQSYNGQAGSFSQQFSLGQSANVSFDFLARDRANWGFQDLSFNVLVDSTVVGSFNPVFGSDYTLFLTNAILLSAGTHTLTFQGIAASPDYSVLIDQVNSNVNAVPVPAAVWLFGSGLLGMFGLGKRKINAA